MLMSIQAVASTESDFLSLSAGLGRECRTSSRVKVPRDKGHGCSSQVARTRRQCSERVNEFGALLLKHQRTLIKMLNQYLGRAC